MQLTHRRFVVSHCLAIAAAFVLLAVAGCGGSDAPNQVIQENELSQYAAENPDTGVYDDSLIGGSE